MVSIPLSPVDVVGFFEGYANGDFVQVSEFAEENDLREIFERFGRVTRVFLAKDRDTGRAKGFAFISFQERSDAAKACEKIDGCECSFSSLIRWCFAQLYILICWQMAMVT